VALAILCVEIAVGGSAGVPVRRTGTVFLRENPFMSAADWIGVPVLGNLPPEQAAEKLRQVGEVGDAETVARAAGAEGKALFPLSWWPFNDRPWQHVGHAFGFVGGTQEIVDAGQVAPQKALRNARLKVTLDGLWAAGYPGGGEHKVLFDFYAQGQTAEGAEHLHFSTTLRVRNGEMAGVRGQPLFVGLQASAEGLNFRCYTVNVANSDDERFLAFLDSDVFRGGLKLLTTLQPSTALLSEMTLALTRRLAERHRNVPVQDFCLGLDFSRQPARAALAEGTYVAVQVPNDPARPWRWEDWRLAPGGQVVSRTDGTTMPPYNYLLFTVSRYTGD
jgi:hypothetical protein